MRLKCPHCTRPHDFDDRSAGRTQRCIHCGKSFVAPAELAVVGKHHSLTSMPVATVVLLHYVTAGLFPLIYLNLLHERMPRFRRNDPSATVAVGLCFVPGINLVWLLFSLHRLCVRINEQRSFNAMPASAPQALAIIVGALLAAGSLAAFFHPATAYVLLGLLEIVVAPLFAGLVQHAVNELCEMEHRPAVAV